MKKIILTVALFCSTIAFSQLEGISGFKKNKHGLYEMSFKDVREAIKKYNYVTDINGADTNGVVFDVMKNPIDFAFFGHDIENQIISVIFTEGNRYKIMFGEFDGREDQDFFDVVDENGKSIQLIYRKK